MKNELWKAANELSLQIAIAMKKNQAIPQNVVDAYFALNDILFHPDMMGIAVLSGDASEGQGGRG